MIQLIHERRADVPLVNASVAFRSGGMHEPEGLEGIARVAARMLRRGAGTFNAMQIERAFGALGADLSASAGTTETVVGFSGLKRTSAPAAGMLAVLLSRPTFEEAELGRMLRETEADLVAYRDNDAYLASCAIDTAMFCAHPYGKNGHGTVESMRRITREDVVAFYEAHYSQANALALVDGDIDEAGAQRLADGLVAGLQGGRASARTLPDPEVRPGRHLVIVDKPERVQCQVAMGCLGASISDPHHFPLSVATAAFGGMFTSRMMQKVRAERGWSYGANASLQASTARGSFSMWTAPAARDVADCIRLELDMLDGFVTCGVTADELALAKSYLVRSSAFARETARQRVWQKFQAQMGGVPDYYDSYEASVGAVTVEQARAATAARLSANDMVVAVVGTASEIADKVTAAIPNLASVTVVPFDSVR